MSKKISNLKNINLGNVTVVSNRPKRISDISMYKVYDTLVNEKLFAKNKNSIISSLSDSLKVTNDTIIDALYRLRKAKMLDIKQNNKVVNLKQSVLGTFHAMHDKQGTVIVQGTNEELLVENSLDALEGDIVRIYESQNDKNVKTALIEKVEKKNKRNITGRVIISKGGIYTFIPDDKKLGENIMIPQDENAKDYVDKKCILTLNNEDNAIKSGRITHVFGLAGDPIAENVSIAFAHGFVKYFSKEVEKEVEKLGTSVSKEEIKGRVDLRDKRFVTIDPATCKDMDDAVYIEKTPYGFKVYVAIADVSHYVKPYSEIDTEAYNRGTSCYLGDGVYPMLPEALSNGICSLNEHVDRLVQAAIIDIDRAGHIMHSDLVKAVINSKHKLSYNTADAILKNENNAHLKYADIKQDIDTMYEASNILTKMRKRRGSLDFDNHEPEFRLDETKTNVIDVNDEHAHLVSTKIIESFMILANEAVAHYFLTNEIETLFRTHNAPLSSGIKRLNEVLDEFGLDPVEPTSQSYQKLINNIANLENQEIKDYLTLKTLMSMDKAKYQPTEVGHFGLASKEYLHFTSPIRRFPDLITHRILSDLQDGKVDSLPTHEQLEIKGLHLSDREICAADAERESNNLMKTIWAENHINEVFHGRIFDIMDEGVLVKSGLVEMFIPTVDLARKKPGTYSPNQNHTKLVNTQSGFEFSVGDKVDFKIIKTDRLTRKITATTNLEKEIYKPTNKDRDIIDEFFEKEHTR